MSRNNKAMSIDKAKTIVRSAMKVIVDFMVGESLDNESYQSKYRKVDAVNAMVIEALGSADFNDDRTAQEFYRLARNIKAWNEDHLSFFCEDPCPQRWMFKTML